MSKLLNLPKFKKYFVLQFILSLYFLQFIIEFLFLISNYLMNFNKYLLDTFNF